MWIIFKWQQLLLSWNNFLKFSLLSKFQGLEIISETFFYRIQKVYCCPFIKIMWNDVKDVIHQHSHAVKFHCQGMEEMTLQGTLHDLCLHTHGRASACLPLWQAVASRYLAHKSFQLAPKPFLISRTDWLQSFCNLNFPKKQHLRVRRVKNKNH